MVPHNGQMSEPEPEPRSAGWGAGAPGDPVPTATFTFQVQARPGLGFSGGTCQRQQALDANWPPHSDGSIEKADRPAEGRFARRLSRPAAAPEPRCEHRGHRPRGISQRLHRRARQTGVPVSALLRCCPPVLLAANLANLSLAHWAPCSVPAIRCLCFPQLHNEPCNCSGPRTPVSNKWRES